MGEHGSAQGATPTGYSEKVGVDGRAWVGIRRDLYLRMICIGSKKGSMDDND